MNFGKWVVARRVGRRGHFEMVEGRDMLSAVPVLSSDSGSPHKIYLDFDGAQVTDSSWLQPAKLSVIHAPAYDIDGNDYDGAGNLLANAFSEAEQRYIDLAWRQMSEDFAPFDVDVTTVEPDASWFTSGGPNGERALRVLFTSGIDDSRLGGTGNVWNTNSGEARFDAWPTCANPACW